MGRRLEFKLVRHNRQKRGKFFFVHHELPRKCPLAGFMSRRVPFPLLMPRRALPPEPVVASSRLLAMTEGRGRFKRLSPCPEPVEGGQGPAQSLSKGPGARERSLAASGAWRARGSPPLAASSFSFIRS